MRRERTVSPNGLALAGEFAVLSQLALRGFDANLTLGHTKHVDILGSDPSTRAMFKMEVKTTLNPPTYSALFGYTLHWRMSAKHERIDDPTLYYCFVHIARDTHRFRFFVVPSAVVATHVRDQHALWLRSPASRTGGQTHKDSDIREFHLGLNEQGDYPRATPLASQYEDRWEFSD